MTPRAAQIKAQRARRKAAAIQNVEQHEKAQTQEARAAARLPHDPLKEDAQLILQALQNGSESARRHAAQIMKHAPAELRATVMQLAEVNSEFKRRRSRKPNGF